MIAMFICPAATARMLTDNLGRQLWLSAGVAPLPVSADILPLPSGRNYGAAPTRSAPPV